jgi:hypothetical protein
MKKKTPRISGIKTRTVNRDTKGRFSTRANRITEEEWTYRAGIVKGKYKILDLKIESLKGSTGEISFFRSHKVPETGRFAGKISHALESVFKSIPVSRHDTTIEITMTAKTSSGKTIKRKLSTGHYNSYELNRHMVGEIVNELFYAYGERPAYPVKIVKWDTKSKRHVSKSATMKRRQLHNVIFNIQTRVETKKQRIKRKGKERIERGITRKNKVPKIEWGMDFTENDDNE